MGYVTQPHSNNAAVLLSTLPAGPRQRRLALTMVVLSALVFVAAVPWAKLPLAHVPAFIGTYQAALVVCDLITAVLLLGQFSIVRRRALLVLAAGYLFTGFTAAAHMLTFPGLFAPDGLLGAGTQSTVWLYMFWHGGFPLFVVAFAVCARRDREPTRRGAAHALTTVFMVSLLACGVVLIATLGHDLLPVLLQNRRYTPTMIGVVSGVWTASLIALVTLWRRRAHSILDVWLMVVMCAWLFDIALSAVLNGGRFDLGFYAGRVYGLLAASFVLCVLLLENGVLYGRLVKAHQRERRKAVDARQLGVRLEAANGMLAVQNRQLEEASRLKTEFLSGMSHELRTPLNAVIGFAELMKDGATGALSTQQSDFVGHIHRSGQHLLALINDILDLSKIEAGKLEIELEPVDLGALFDDSLSLLSERARAGHIELVRDAQSGGGMLLADGRRIRQILYNLVSNALKFTPRQGRVTLRDRRVDRVRAAGAMPGDGVGVRMPLAPSEFETFVEISVFDTGIGISATDAGRLFMPFMQVGDAATRRGEGTGLGLTMVKRLAELHGGTVALTSEPGRGSCFTVWLPWRDAASQQMQDLDRRALARPQQLPRPDAGNPLALVIEDEEEAATLMRLQLEAEGFRVHRVASAEAALELGRAQVARERPAVITVDIVLPGMDGWEFIARLEALPAWADVPVVVVSVQADRQRGFSLGASLVLQKPVQREVLARGLARLGLAPLSGRDITVLVVDDDPHTVEILTTQLRQSQYTVLRALGGKEGIDLARRFRPNLIALDLEMPDVNGFDVVRALANDDTTAHIPIVVVTAEQPTHEQRERLNGHILDIVNKGESRHSHFIAEVRRALGTASA